MTNPIIARSLRRIYEEGSDEEALFTQSLAEESLKAGQLWTHREVFTLDTGQTQQVLVRNDDGYVIRGVSRSFESDSTITGTIYANVDVTTDGTEMPYVNTLIQDPLGDSPPYTIAYGGDYSGGTEVLPFASVEGSPSGRTTSPTRPVPVDVFQAESGANLMYEIESEADGNRVVVEYVMATSDPLE